MSLTRRILLGLGAGIAFGIFFGEKASFLHWPAKGFVDLLQVTVLPYLVGSLVFGIASGTPSIARRLLFRGGRILAALWAVALLLVFLSPLVLPAEKGGSFYSTEAPGADAGIDWIGLYIPSNPFHSLANNVVPAVVLFSILLGVALLGVAGKDRILGPLAVVNETLGRAGSLLVGLTPFGLFAMAGHSAGTLRLEELERLGAFLLLFSGLSLFLTVLLLPGLVSALTGIPYRRILSLALDPLLTAFFTSNLFIVLPLLAERAKELLGEAGLGRAESEEAVDVLVPASFTFPHSAKLLSLSFVLFAGWFAGSPVALGRYPALAGAGLLSLFGGVNTAMQFLLDLVRLPADLFELFVVSSVLNSRFGSAAAAMHTLALALLGAFSIAGRLRIDKRRLSGFALAGGAVLAAFLAGSHFLLLRVLPGPESAAFVLDRLRLSGAWGQLADAEVLPGLPAPTRPPERGRRLEEIVRRGSLRFGFTDDEVPWSFRNRRGEVVGIEADLAHALARGLRVRLKLVPVGRDARADALAAGSCDVAAGRIKPDLAVSTWFSRPFAMEAWAFLVPDHERERFRTLERIRSREGLRIAVLRVPEWIERLEASFPNAQVLEVDSILDYVSSERFDAMYTGFERATAYSLLYPRFTAVAPEPALGSVPIAFAVPEGEEDLLTFVNAWLEDENASGLVGQKLDYWVRGEGARRERSPRWSFGKDVLGLWE